MIHSKEYSLWMVPPERIFEQLTVIISRLSKQHSTPYFEPHTTLLGDITLPEEEIVLKTAELAGLISPFTLHLTTVSYRSDYFRSLFIKAEVTEEIVEANQKARMLFNREDDPVFFPHVSLMYGNVPSETKEDILSEIGNDFHMTWEVHSIHLVLCSSNIVPEKWRRLQQFSFQ